jgi:hypothetical protein
MQRFDAEQWRRFLTCGYTAENNGSEVMGDDFPILPGESYLVSMKQGLFTVGLNNKRGVKSCLVPGSVRRGVTRISGGRYKVFHFA